MTPSATTNMIDLDDSKEGDGPSATDSMTDLEDSKEGDYGPSATASMTDLDDSKKGDYGIARTKWSGTCLVVLSEVLGTGILGLPFVAVTLGWITTMIAIPIFAMFAAYSGSQLKAVKLAHPEVCGYADAGTKLIGPAFGTFTKACMLLNWGSLAIYYLIATADGIGNIYDRGFFSCNMNRTIIAAILLVVPTQSRDFHVISKYLSLPSFLAIIVALIIVIVVIVEEYKEDGEDSFGETTIVGLEPGTGIFQFMQSLSAIIFAFQGQSIFMELMTEMKSPRDFSKSSNLAYSIMALLYTTIIVLAYGMQGDGVQSFLPDSIADGPAQTVVGVLVVLHIIVAYVITVQPFHMFIHSVTFPKTYNCATFKGQLHWLIITVGFIQFAWIIANLIPFFSDLQSLIGSLLGAPIVFGWPSLYFLLVNKQNIGSESSWKETFQTIGVFNSTVCLLSLFVLMPFFFVFGTWGGIMGLIADIQDSATPFHC